MNINLYNVESNFIKVPKKKRNFDDEGYTKKKKGKKDYSKQRERKRNSY